MNNSLFLLAAGAVIIPAAGSAAVRKTSNNTHKPNVIIILADDLGWGDLSCQWAKDLRTPNIDAIFTGGIRLDNFHANCNVSSPSRAGLMTGRYPIMVGVPGVIRGTDYTFGYLAPDAILLPSMLRKAGYSTAIVGKWHLGLKSPNLPGERGFDYFAGFLGDMMNDYYTHERDNKNYMRINNDPVNPQGHATDIFTNWAIDYLNSRVKLSNPFFLYLAYNAPHAPLQPPQEFEDAIKQREPGISDTRAKYLGLIEHMDRNIGRLFATLKANGQLENTLIIFTSDNGGFRNSESNNGPNRGWKGEMYEGGIKVPCAFYRQGVFKPVRLDNLVMMSDIFPTLCELAGVPVKHHIDGMSVLPLLRGGKQDTDNRYLFWAMRTDTEADIQAAGRYNSQKVLRPTSNAPFEYYDMKADPMETTNLGPQGPMYDDLTKRINEMIREGNKIPWREGMVIERD